jgi:hypothetical protein
VSIFDDKGMPLHAASPKILPAKSTDFLRTKPRANGSMRGLYRNWSVIPGVGYRMDIPDIQVTFDVARVRIKFDEVWGLLTVRAQFAGAKVVADNVLSMGDFSFSSVRSRQERSREIAERSCAAEIDWRGLVEELSIKVLSHEERGDPEISMADVIVSDKEYQPDISAAGMPLLKHHPVIWFGDGGAAKSLLALYAAADLAENGWRVLYCDWELTAEEHAQRLKQLIGSGIDSVRHTFFYRRCNRPFVDDILPIRDIIAKRSIQFLVCDSLSFGAKSPIESSESALGYQQALRECGDIGSLHIAHINRSEQGDQRPFGSTYWHNMARATWFLKRGEHSPYPNEITVGLYNKKANLSGHHAPFAQRIVFTPGHIEIGPGGLDTDTDLIDKLNVVQKIEIALREGPKTQAALVDECASKSSTIDRHIRGNKKLFERVFGSDGIQRIRLVESV